MLKKFIYLSSVSVYEKSNKSPFSENGKTSNIGIYNSNKMLIKEYTIKDLPKIDTSKSKPIISKTKDISLPKYSLST